MGEYSVYMHSTPSNKRYVGITSNSPKYRWGKNGYGYKRHPHFFNAILKYGWENITHIILFVDLSEEDAKQLEINLIAKYKTNDRRFGYNGTTGGDGTSGVDRNGIKNGRSNKVKCITTNEVFDTITIASIKYNINRSHIGSVCKGKRKYSGKLNNIPLTWEYYKGVM